MHADLIVTNGNLLTMDDARPHARAMAVRRGRIERVGDDAAVLALAGPETARIDADGKTILPGFHDCHCHLLWAGLLQIAEADLVGSASIGEVQARLRRFAETTAGWIVGHGFDQEKLAERRFPTQADLDAVSATRPILITRICGHAAIANAAAIALSGAVPRPAAPGLYTEKEIAPFRALVPPPDEATLDRALLHASRVALRTGITSVQTMLDTPDQMQTYQRVRRRLGRLPVRVVAMPPERAADALFAHGITTGFGDAWLRVGGAKFFSDGSLGARTALLDAPYADGPGIGERIYAPHELKRRVAEVAAMGFQIVVHAIGDAALRETLDAIEHALTSTRLHAGAERTRVAPARASGAGAARVRSAPACGEDLASGVVRHRVEHASVCPPDQLARLAAVGVMVTLQPQFVTSDTWTGERLGPARLAWAYPFRAMLDAGVRVGLSSDAPVETLDAFACLAAAVGRAPWSPDGGLTPLEAIRAYTLGSAALAHREHDLGSLEVGKFADFVVLSEDPTEMDAEAIRRLRAERVFVDGEESV